MASHLGETGLLAAGVLQNILQDGMMLQISIALRPSLLCTMSAPRAAVPNGRTRLCSPVVCSLSSRGISRLWCLHCFASPNLRPRAHSVRRQVVVVGFCFLQLTAASTVANIQPFDCSPDAHRKCACAWACLVKMRIRGKRLEDML